VRTHARGVSFAWLILCFSIPVARSLRRGPSESVTGDSRDSRSIRRDEWLESTFAQKKIFIAVSRRLARASARREHAKEAVFTRVAAFMSQLK